MNPSMTGTTSNMINSKGFNNGSSSLGPGDSTHTSHSTCNSTVPNQGSLSETRTKGYRNSVLLPNMNQLQTLEEKKAISSIAAESGEKALLRALDADNELVELVHNFLRKHAALVNPTGESANSANSETNSLGCQSLNNSGNVSLNIQINANSNMGTSRPNTAESAKSWNSTNSSYLNNFRNPLCSLLEDALASVATIVVRKMLGTNNNGTSQNNVEGLNGNSNGSQAWSENELIQKLSGDGLHVLQGLGIVNGNVSNCTAGGNSNSNLNGTTNTEGGDGVSMTNSGSLKLSECGGVTNTESGLKNWNLSVNSNSSNLSNAVENNSNNNVHAAGVTVTAPLNSISNNNPTSNLSNPAGGPSNTSCINIRSPRGSQINVVPPGPPSHSLAAIQAEREKEQIITGQAIRRLSQAVVNGHPLLEHGGCQAMTSACWT